MKNKKSNKNLYYFLCFVFSFALLFSFIFPETNLNIAKAITESKYSGGSGTSSDPFLISSRADLDSLSKFVYQGGETKNKYYELTNSIDMENKNFTPIGTMIGSTIYYFDGHFNGNNALIYNLKIENSSLASGDLGLFAYVRDPDDNGSFQTEIKNVRLANGYIILTANSKSAGGIVGSMYKNAKIENCSNNSVNITVNNGDYGATYTGGILGACHSNDATINLCYNLATIKNSTYSTAKAGGIAGEMTGEITQCCNYGNVTSGVDDKTSQSYAGGITGINGNINNCFNMGEVKACSTLIEEDNSYSSVYSNNYYVLSGWYNTYTKERKAYSGGISGYISNTVTNSYNLASVIGGFKAEYVYFSYDPYGTFTGNTSYGSWISDTLNTKIIIYSGNIIGDGANPINCYSTKNSKSDGYDYNLSYENEIYVTGGNTSVVSGREKFGFIPIPVEYNYTLKNGKVSLIVSEDNFIINMSGDTEYKKDYFDFIPTNKSTGSINDNLLNFNRTSYYVNKNVTNTNITVSNLGGNNVWSQNSAINSGYPYLKNLYW